MCAQRSGYKFSTRGSRDIQAQGEEDESKSAAGFINTKVCQPVAQIQWPKVLSGKHTDALHIQINVIARAYIYTANNKYIIRLLPFGWRAEQVITISFLEFDSLFCNLLGHIFQSALL